MATLVSPGVSVTVDDQSYYIPATAPTVPLFFIATEADKKQPDGISDALGTKEHSVVRTITSKTQSLRFYGIPKFRKDTSFRPMHGDARNEYGLMALNQFLDVGSVAYVLRANVDLADKDINVYTADAPIITGAGNGTVINFEIDQKTAVAELLTLTAISAEEFIVNGFISGNIGNATVGVPFSNGTYSFTIQRGSIAFTTGDVISMNVTESRISNPLGKNDAAKRLTIVTALQAEINSNQDIRSEAYEYNIIICPGYHEVADELLNLSLNIKEEAFVISDTPFDKSPEDTAQWSLTNERARSCNIAYYYPHALASNIDGVDVFCAASGLALKTFAYSDNVSELWFAPAGPRRGLITGVSKIGYVTGELGTATTFVEANLNEGQRNVLYEFQKNVNPITWIAGRGYMILGQKTSAVAASALDRINVVRLLMYIRRSLRKNLFILLFEPNDKLTRDNAKAIIDNFLGDIMVRRGLYDFAVDCSEHNNTPERIDRNELWCDVSLKPTKSIEFIYVPMRVLSTGASM